MQDGSTVLLNNQQELAQAVYAYNHPPVGVRVRMYFHDADAWYTGIVAYIRKPKNKKRRSKVNLVRFSDGDQHPICDRELFNAAGKYQEHLLNNPVTTEANCAQPPHFITAADVMSPEEVHSGLLQQPKLFIPQGVKGCNGEIIYDNSCPVDAVLQFFHVLTECNVLTRPMECLLDKDNLLGRTFKILSEGDPHGARQLFIKEFSDPPDFKEYSDVYRYFANEPLSPPCQLEYEAYCPACGFSSTHIISSIDTDVIINAIEDTGYGLPERKEGWEHDVEFLLRYEFTESRALPRASKRPKTCNQCKAKAVMMRSPTRFNGSSHLLCLEFSMERPTRSISELAFTLNVGGKKIVQRGSVNCNDRHWTALMRMQDCLLLFDGSNRASAHERYGWAEGEAAMAGGYRHSFVVYEVTELDESNLFGLLSFDYTKRLEVMDACHMAHLRRKTPKTMRKKGGSLFSKQRRSHPTSYKDPIVVDLDVDAMVDLDSDIAALNVNNNG
jgi:hypothetical protein